MKKGEWVGVDLDGTLAQYDGWKGIKHIGEPVPAMLKKVMQLLADGVEVRIVTARVGGAYPDAAEARCWINSWCLMHLNQLVPVTAEKDQRMIELWDDRVLQVVANTGEFVPGQVSRVFGRVV